MVLYCLCYVYYFFVFKQKTAYELRISDWGSDVCSSDLDRHLAQVGDAIEFGVRRDRLSQRHGARDDLARDRRGDAEPVETAAADTGGRHHALRLRQRDPRFRRRRTSCDQILLRGYLLGEKPLLAREVRIGELKPCPCCLDLALDLCRLAALADRDGLAAPDRLAEVARQRDQDRTSVV